MNAPNPRSRHVLEEGELKVKVVEDTKIPNAATFTFQKEDHTLAGMLKSQLLLNSHVLFCGYKVSHPLTPQFTMNVQTDGTSTPWQAMDAATRELIVTLSKMRDAVLKEQTVAETLKDNDEFGLADAEI